MCQTPAVGAASDLRNLSDLVAAAAQRRPDATALVQVGLAGRHTVTWANLEADVAAAAAGLATLGLHAGDRVAISLSNTTAFVVAYFGALRAGIVAMPLNTSLTQHEVSDLLEKSGARVLLCDQSSLHAAEEAVAGTHRVLVDPAGFDAVVGAGRAHPVRASTHGGEDLAVLLFTSGTSGQPRGAMLSHRALMANHDQALSLHPVPMTEDDVVLLVLPLFHVYGLNSGLSMLARTGATGVLVDRFDPQTTLSIVRDEHVTNIPGAPPMFQAWARDPDLAVGLASVRLLLSGAAPLPPAARDAIAAATGVVVHEGYGLTETAPALTTTMASAVPKAGSVGRPLPGVELRLVDELGGEVDESDTGEVTVRGANLFSGYWPGGVEGPDDQGWWRTGDVGYLDGDGDLFLVDRRKELVLVSGFNVYPREVEDVLAQHPSVREVAVIAVPDEQTGEAVKAIIVAEAGSGLTVDDVLGWSRERLARFKTPTVVELVATLPHSVTGKVAKGRLREEAGREPT